MTVKDIEGQMKVGRTPQGVRGLKYHLYFTLGKPRKSQPPNGAWIEKRPAHKPSGYRQVAPRKGCVD